LLLFLFLLDNWTPLAYKKNVSRKLITVAETPLFVRQAKDVWDDAGREAFVNFIALNPEAGDVIPATGGVRKIRWGRTGTGKRGGARVIYFYHDVDRPLYLLMVYAKAHQENLTPDEKRAVRKLAAMLKS
jgi:mRNA-degrading endonuclease RelE of RelBE toxin-antitoxin system